jgi:hypothetical protein
VSRLEEIVRRKQLLIDRCAQDREDLAASCRRIHFPLGFGTVLTLLGRTLKSYPLFVTGLSTLLVGGYGGRLARAVGKLFTLGQTVLPLWSWWSRRRKHN